MVRIWLIGLASWLFLGAALDSCSAEAANAPPTIKINPTEMSLRSLSANDAAQIEITIQAAEQELSDLVLTTFSNDGIAATLIEGEAKVAKLVPHSAYAWRLRITRVGGALFYATRLNVRVAYDATESGDRRVHGFVYSSLTISPLAIPSPLELASVEIKGALPSLSHERSGTLFVVINNKYLRPVKVENIDTRTPKFIELKQQLTTTAGASPASPPPFSIPVGEARIVPYAVAVPDKVVPGNYGVVVAARLETEDGLTGTATASKDVEISVLGDSLLSLIGVPSFLVLPGFLIIMSWRLMSSLGKTEEQRAKFPLQAGSADFWAVAILLSLGAAALYPIFVRLLFNSDRNYLVSYGFIDFVYVFSFALALGGTSYLAWQLGSAAYRRFRRNALAKITPSEADDPLTLLDKLAKHGSTIVFRKALPKGGTKDQSMLILTPWREATHIWVAPPVIIEPIDAHDFDGLNKLQEIEEGKIQDAAEIARLIRQQVADKKWTVYWQPHSTGLRREQVEDLTQLTSKALLVEVAV
jgi:hypothetical protein